MYARYAPELKHPGVLTLTLALGACDPASPPADTPSRAPVTEMSAEALLPVTRAAGSTHRTRPGETVRVVRFNVKPDAREAFERFFWESLRPAAAKRQGVPIEDLDLGGFRLLIPSEPNPQGLFTYYVLADPAGGSLGEGEVMRDMVQEAFPGEEGRERVRRWMQSMVLVEPLAPVGESFTEADLRAPYPLR